MKKIFEEALELLRAVERYDLEELELEIRGMRFHLSRGQEVPVQPAALDAVRAPVTHEPPPPPEPEEHHYAEIRSPMVGMFYRAPAPDKPQFVEIGQIVDVGQPVCIIEAMKLMNIINADVKGRIVKVVVENQTPVQANQVLFLVEPVAAEGQ
jgi:acetyl-CoA carboxylase biotin carboxyl carrier protein